MQKQESKQTSDGKVQPNNGESGSTADIMSEGMNKVGTVEMGQAVVMALN